MLKTDCSGGQYIAMSCAMTDPTILKNRNGLDSGFIVNTDLVSERELNTLKSWNSTSVVRAMVRACSMPDPWLICHRYTPSVPSASTSPMMTIRSIIRREMTGSFLGRGGWSSMPFSAFSKAMAISCRPFVTRFIQMICAGSRGRGWTSTMVNRIRAT